MPPEAPHPSRWSVTLLSWGSFALALAESICVAAVALSGIRVAIGMTSLIAATAAGPAHGFHRNAVRIPILAIGAIGSIVVLLLVWNEGRMRKNPAAAWRLQPLTAKQKRSRRIQVVLAILSLLVIAAELFSHPWFHHEL
ncbi:MAG TPA: hypothetical protein VGL89_10980 [Candidatus Koribacter sp.]|jgi:hypothetical protein